MKKNIAFGGVTRVPGGAVSSDGDLCAAIDVCNDGMGLEMIEKPEELFTLRNYEDDTAHLKFTEELLCIHEPEGEDKHYITQLFVKSTATAEPPSDSQGEGDTPTDPSEPADPGTSFDDPLEPSEPFEPVEPDPRDDYIVPDEDYYVPDVTTPDDFDPQPFQPTGEEWEMRERFERDSDNGGITITPPPGGWGGGGSGGGGGETPTTLSVGIYLCYWEKAKGETEYTCKQVIDITPYGKVTAIQPMGNTLVCNHEGGTDTVEVDGTPETITYPAEIRYWLWKGDNMETVDDQEVNVPKYIGLGTKPPMVNITFGLNSTFEFYPKTRSDIDFNIAHKPTSYERYGGVTFETYAYLDTIPYYWDTSWDTAQVPPYDVAKSDSRMSHWTEEFSIENVISPDGHTDVAGIKNSWTTNTLSSYNKFIAEQHRENKFVFPFYVRYAIELYDGSLIMHSNPILMIPNSRGPIFALDGKAGIEAKRIHDDGESYTATDIVFRGRTYGFSSTLMYKTLEMSGSDLTRLKNWKDLIRGINIYVTPPIYNYNQGGQVFGWHCMDSDAPGNNGKNPWKKFYTVGKVKYKDNSGITWSDGHYSGTSSDAYEVGTVSLDFGFTDILTKEAVPYSGNLSSHKHNLDIFWPWPDETIGGVNHSFPTPDYCLTIPQKDEGEVYELHENAGQFYKLASIEYEKLVNLVKHNGMTEEAAVDIKGKKVNAISNQDIMQDDNGSRDTISAEVLYGYNRRLNMAKVAKILSSPLLPCVTWARDYTGDSDYIIHVYARNGEKIARLVTRQSKVDCCYPLYFFYPNTNAYKAVIWQDDNVKYRLNLTESKVLNGSFWLSHFLDGSDGILEHQLDNPVDDRTVGELNKAIDESNKIYTSATDNPFVIPFGNINIAGGGDVRALCAATQAMSQGQFGQHPMYTFTSEGVWAMSVNDTGGWSTIQPVTRDVIVDGTKPLSLDSTVLFLSERGLLQLAGSDIKVLSDILQGADPLILNTPNFGLHRLDDLCASTATDTNDLLNIATALALNKFPESAWMTYDYDNARIYVTPQNGNGSWVYNLKSGIWTQATTKLDNQVVSYPECEAQCEGKVMRISVDRAITNNLRGKGLVISRPIKLDDMGLLKRWRELAVRGRFKPYSTAVQVALWGTRDWIDSALVASSTRNRLTRWSGSPYFGHSVGLFLTRPNYAMQIAGMDIEIDSEHDNKLR